MSDKPVVIEVKDGVDKGVARNLSEISSQARGAYQNVEKLIRQLNRVKPTALTQFNSVVSNAERQMQQAALASERLATQQARTAAATAQAAAAQARLADTTARTAAAAQRRQAAEQAAANATRAAADADAARTARIQSMVQESMRAAQAIRNETSERWRLEQAEASAATTARRLSGANDRVRASVDLVAQKTREKRAIMNELNATLNRGVQSMEEMYRVESLLDKAMAKGAMSADQQAAALARLDKQVKILSQNKEVARIDGIEQRFNQVMARSPKHQQAFNKGLLETRKAAGLARHELINLGYQVNDIGVSLASGQKPLTVLIQQGAQIGQIFGASRAGVGAILRQLAGIVGRLALALWPLALALTSVIVPLSLFNRQLNEGFDEAAYLKGLKLTEDQLKRLEESGTKLTVTFGDNFKAVFQVIGGYAASYFKPMTDNISKWWNQALDWMTGAISTFTRAMLGLFVAIPGIAEAVFKDIPASLELMFKTSANGIIETVETMLNGISRAINASGLGKLLGVEGAAEIKLPRWDLSDSAQSVQEDIMKALEEGFSKADELIDKFSRDVAEQARKNRDARVLAAAGEADKRNKRGFDPVKELAQINAQLDMQAKNMFVLSTARDAANRADEIALRFAKEGHPLRQAEIEALRNKIQALNDAKEVQTQFDRIYQSAIGPMREYEASLEAAERLLNMGAISQAKYNAELARAEDAFASASDPLYEMNKQLDEQIKLLRIAGPQREIEQQVQQVINKALQEGKPLREQEINDLREKLGLVQQLNAAAAMRDELQSGSLAQRNFDRQNMTVEAIGQVGVNGFTGGDAISALARDNPALQHTAEFAQAQIASYTDMYAQIDALRQADIISETSAIQAKMALFQEQYQTQIQGAMTALGQLSTLQHSENKKQAEIGKKAAIAQTMINTYQSATAAFSAMAGIPFIGPALGAAAAVAAVAAGMANVQQIRAQHVGFKQGGYTGNIPTDSIAGPVHGQEYVFDAPATARIGVANLEALRRGRIPVDALGQGQSASREAVPTHRSNVGSSEISYNQTVNVTVAGKRDRRTAEQEARAIRRETTRELVRSGG